MLRRLAHRIVNATGPRRDSVENELQEAWVAVASAAGDRRNLNERGEWDRLRRAAVQAGSRETLDAMLAMEAASDTSDDAWAIAVRMLTDAIKLATDPRKRAAPREPQMAAEWTDSMARMVAGVESDVQEARRVREEPWYADAVVDLTEAERRWADAGHVLPNTLLIVPNPYFVLPLAALVKWGFVTAVEVREATRWATSNTPPVRWQNPLFLEPLTFMGWSDVEACVRVGLFHWRTGPDTADPGAASIEARLRASGQIYDVPRPAHLA